MSTVGSYDRQQFLGEVNTPLQTNTGMKTPAQQKAAVLANLGITATGAEITAAASVSGRAVLIPDAATYTVLASNSGKTHILPDLTANCTISLPTPSIGLQYNFIYSGSAADAQNWILSAGAGNFFKGGVMFADQDAGSAADEISAVFANGTSHVTFTVNVPQCGTHFGVICDGTKWVVYGFVNSNTACAFS